MKLSEKVCLSVVIISFITIETVFAITPCKSCGPNYVACIDEDHYYYCPDGKTPLKQGGVCPKGQVCTEDQQICQPKEKAKRVCGNCETCTSGFVCRSKDQFEYCQSTTPTGIIGKCPEGQYCSIANVVKNHNICVESCLDEPTCYANEFSTTPAPTNNDDYSKSCANVKDSGYYKNLADPSEKTYVYCELLDNNMYSVLYECKIGFFSATEKKCVATKPN